jgi:hypothetical protein
MKVKGDGIFSINTSASGGFGNAGISLPEAVADAGGGADMPPITDNLSIYLDPNAEVYSDAGSTLAEDGDNIRQMNDLSGNNNTLNQTSASTQPLYDTTTFGNGNAAIYAINDYLTLTSALSAGVNDDYTMYMVYKKSSNSNIYYSLTGANIGYPRFEHKTTQLQFRDNQGSSAPFTYTDNTDLKVITLTLDRNITAHGEHKLYVNGAYEALRNYTIGWDVDIISMFRNATYGMYYGSFLWYSGVAHSATDVATISDWLNEKYSFPNY